MNEARELEMDLDIMVGLGKRLKELDAEYVHFTQLMLRSIDRYSLRIHPRGRSMFT